MVESIAEKSYSEVNIVTRITSLDVQFYYNKQIHKLRKFSVFGLFLCDCVEFSDKNYVSRRKHRLGSVCLRYSLSSSIRAGIWIFSHLNLNTKISIVTNSAVFETQNYLLSNKDLYMPVLFNNHVIQGESIEKRLIFRSL